MSRSRSFTPSCAGAGIFARLLVLVICTWVGTGAHAGIRIELPGTTPTVENNIRAYLSLTRYAEREDVTAEVMSRLQRRIVTEARQALEPLGYYEPQISYEIERSGDDWLVTIHVTPGRPVRLSDVQIRIVGEGAELRAINEIIEARELKPGLRLNHGTYERVKDSLLRAARSEGYLDAKVTTSDLLIDRVERRATATIELDTGPQYHFGTITTAQDVITEESMRRLLRMEEGDPYTLERLLRTQYVLDDSLYFSSVDIDSGEPDRQARTVPVTITAAPNRKHRFATALGYGTDTELRGRFTWDNRRVNEHGHRMKVELLGSSIVKELSARYAIPIFDVALEKLEFTAALSDEELGDTLSERAEIGAGLTQVHGRWQRVLFLRASQETTTDPQGNETDDFYLIPGISYSTLPSYVVGDRLRPYYLYAELRGSPSTLGSDASFLQLRLQAERVFDLSELWHLRVRGELGASRVADFSQLPASQRFFAGGERSVRGFQLNELSPRDAQGRSIGGENLATGTVELQRDLPRNFGVAVFADAGNAFNSFEDPGLEYSAGIGVRYRIAVASFGVDIAQALSDSRSPRLHLYIATQF